MIQLPQPSLHKNCRVVSLTIPRDVRAEARTLVHDVGISLSVYLTELLRADLAFRKKLPPESARQIKTLHLSLQRDCHIGSYTIPRDVQAEARTLVDAAGISLSAYVTELLRDDLAARKQRQQNGKAA